jgi:hypothetical protein
MQSARSSSALTDVAVGKTLGDPRTIPNIVMSSKACVPLRKRSLRRLMVAPLYLSQSAYVGAAE